jgi:hypothetical protein
MKDQVLMVILSGKVQSPYSYFSCILGPIDPVEARTNPSTPTIKEVSVSTGRTRVN